MTFVIVKVPLASDRMHGRRTHLHDQAELRAALLPEPPRARAVAIAADVSACSTAWVCKVYPMRVPSCLSGGSPNVQHTQLTPVHVVVQSPLPQKV